jgi:hypothetical protein
MSIDQEAELTQAAYRPTEKAIQNLRNRSSQVTKIFREGIAGLSPNEYASV